MLPVQHLTLKFSFIRNRAVNDKVRPFLKLETDPPKTNFHTKNSFSYQKRTPKTQCDRHEVGRGRGECKIVEYLTGINFCR